jgi:hypothetical protein
MGLLWDHGVFICGRVVVSARVPEFLQRETRWGETLLGFCEDFFRLTHLRHGVVDPCRRSGKTDMTRVRTLRAFHGGTIAGFGPSAPLPCRR